MATYSDVTINVISLSVSTAATHYTVPASTRAFVHVQKVSMTAGGAGDSVTFGAGSVTETELTKFPDSTGSNSATQFLNKPILLNAGDTIVTASGTETLDCVIVEYSNP